MAWSACTHTAPSHDLRPRFHGPDSEAAALTRPSSSHYQSQGGHVPGSRTTSPHGRWQSHFSIRYAPLALQAVLAALPPVQTYKRAYSRNTMSQQSSSRCQCSACRWCSIVSVVFKLMRSLPHSNAGDSEPERSLLSTTIWSRCEFGSTFGAVAQEYNSCLPGCVHSLQWYAPGSACPCSAHLHASPST